MGISYKLVPTNAAQIDNRIFVIRDDALYVSEDDGATFDVLVASGMPNYLGQYKKDCMVAWTPSNPTNFITTNDNFATQQNNSRPTPTAVGFVLSHANNGDTVIISYYNNTPIRTTDNFQTVQAVPHIGDYLSVSPTSELIMLGMNQSTSEVGLHLSTDGGLNFTKVFAGSANFSFGTSGCAFTSDDAIYFGGNITSLSRAGLARAASPFTSVSLVDLGATFAGDSVSAGIVVNGLFVLGFSSGKIAYGNGTSFNLATGYFPTLAEQCYSIVFNGQYFFAQSLRRILKSPDGINWVEVFNEGSSPSSIRSVMVANAAFQ